MALPHLDAQLRAIEGPHAVLIPLRSLTQGKHRLDSVLDAGQRAALIQLMANRVVSAAHELPVLIVHDDPDVAEWAAGRNAASLRPNSPGLNNAVAAGRDLLAAHGVERVIIAHADLPGAIDLRPMLTNELISIAPDRHGEGTNVLCLPTALPFDFAYGPGSFARHCAQARAMGIEPRIVDAPDLALDLDHPDDVHSFAATTSYAANASLPTNDSFAAFAHFLDEESR